MSYRSNSSSTSNSGSSSGGYGVMGLLWFVLGATCSWIINKSVVWAIFHGIFGCLYILYLCLGCGGGFDPVQNWAEKTFGTDVEEHSEDHRPRNREDAEPETAPVVVADTDEVVVEANER